MVEEIADLKNYVQALEESNEALSAQLAESREELTAVAAAHDNDNEAILALQRTLDENTALHLVKSDGWKNQVEELQRCNDSLKEELYNKQISASAADEAGREEVATLRGQFHALEEQNAQLSARLADATSQINKGECDALVEEIACLKDRAQALEDNNAEVSAKLTQSEVAHENDQETINSLQCSLDEKESLLQDGHQQAMGDQDKLHRADLDTWKSRATEAEQAHINDQATITSLQNALTKKQSLLQDKLHEKLINQDKLHQNDIGTLKTKVIELQESNAVLSRELSELRLQTSVIEDHTECNSKFSSLQMDLQNALNDREEKQIQHNLEVASVNAEFRNAMNSLDELQKENQQLKGDIESLSSMEGVKDKNESRNFEKEMNAAHSRFVSMEKALEERVSRLQKEKDKLVADFSAEMINKEEEHTQTKIELSAWKLEMQNALNDIEALKKERDELKMQVESYVASLEAVCIGKAQLEEKMHSLGITG
ncbi:hypothetical protein ACHAXR_010366 [Thalassiosira sp. AJA248-18]